MKSTGYLAIKNGSALSVTVFLLNYNEDTFLITNVKAILMKENYTLLGKNLEKGNKAHRLSGLERKNKREYNY